MADTKDMHYPRHVFFLLVLFAALASFITGCKGTPQAVLPPEPQKTLPPEPQTAAAPEKPEGPAAEIPPPVTDTGTQGILARMAEFLAQGKHDEALALFDAIDPEEAGTTGIRLLKASVLSSAGRPAEGRAIAQEVLSKEPGNIDALMVLATAEGASGKEKEQRAILEQVIKSDPANAEALIGLGGIAFRAKSYRAAGSYYDRVLETEPDSMDALLGRALIYRYGRDPQNAEELLNRAVTLYPDEAAPRSERARLYKNEGYQKQALIDLDAAKKIDGQNYWIAVDRGSVLIDLGRKQEALEEFKRAIELEPGNFLAYVYSAGIKDEIKDYDGAEHDFAILAKLKPDYYFASEGLGMHKMRKQLWAEARDAFMDAYRYAPNEPSYALLAAMNWMRAGKISDPRQFLEQALRKVQRESLEWYMLRLYHDLAGDNDLVIKIDKEKNPERKARMLYYLANYYDIRGNRSLADKYFLQVQSLDVKTIPEWRLNVWTVAERGLALD